MNWVYMIVLFAFAGSIFYSVFMTMKSFKES